VSTTTIKLSTEELLQAVGQLSWGEFNDFLARATTARQPTPVLCLSARETELLLKINHGPPAVWRETYDQLAAKRRKTPLSAAEEDQLAKLIDQLEHYDAERLEWLTELAAIRQMPLRALMQSLGLAKAVYG
jgi:hypothetical protein